MRTLLRNARALTATIALCAAPLDAPAQSAADGYPYGYLNQTYTSGLYLPQVPQPNGQDEIRAADGTTCRSSMAGNDAYLDVGGIGGQNIDGSFNQGSVYGRIIVPLGTLPRRLDCTALYNLEIARLRHELELVRSGLPSAAARGGKSWAEEGWSDSSLRQNASQLSGVAVLAPRDGVVPSHLAGPGAAPANRDVGLRAWTAEAMR